MTSPLQQKLKISGPSVVTANRLADGAVVYRTGDGQWSTDIADAAIVETSAAATTLLAAAKSDGTRAVDAYVAPVQHDSGKVRPGNLRELIRLRGPTIDLPITFGI
jgi:hypothetical protein